MLSPNALRYVVLALGMSVSAATAQDRQIRVAVTVAGTPQAAWSLWTTDEGVRSFFAPGSHIDLRVDGAYEIFFMPSAPPGRRGADDMRLLAVEPHRRLAFTWNAPETLPQARAQRTVVTLHFTPVGDDSTMVTLRHTGWGDGPVWDEAIGYFESAWNGFVMAAFKHRVAHGPIDWSRPPTLEPVQSNAIEHLVPRASQ
jgi:uncharacterized protein YndB with AHSA1/START domain